MSAATAWDEWAAQDSPRNQTDALTWALVLAVIAANESDAVKATDMARKLADCLNAGEIAAAKVDALAIVNAPNAGTIS